ncbi:uncharacterized protein LTR77_004429 [Saxophila tyrrhenica]|uniref:DUF7918 domain-containing protein n=1 Tax=Saxophila tyrrhenica TaxID=1690608 RepID=A0AAV9PDF3_9PEZI|nr:hypothetical protein LTR77_004429 [Saxophila tyrrhenica]
MVRSNDIPGLVVEVTVGGEALREYQKDDLEDVARTTTRYIEAVTGQEFVVSIKLLEDFKFMGNCLAAKVYADGTMLTSALMCYELDVREVEGIEIGDDTVRKASFADVEIVSDRGVVPGEASKVKNVGTIVVVLSHEQTTEEDDSEDEYIQNAIAAIESISKKDVKGQAISHKAEFADAMPYSTTYVSSQPVVGEPNPFATIVFRYRSHGAMLQALRIIERTPTPPPPEERDHAALSPEDIRDMQRRLVELTRQQEEHVRVKREREDGDDNPRPRRVARAAAGDTQLELDDTGSFRDRSETLAPADRVVIEMIEAAPLRNATQQA